MNKSMATIDELKKVRLEKLVKLKKAGIDPYPASVKRDHTIAQAFSMTGKTVAVTGRITGLRGHGKIVFADLVDGSGKIQAVFKSDLLSKASATLVAFLDIGDFFSRVYPDANQEKTLIATPHDILTMASIVEREVRSKKDREIVADIFWRRYLIGMALQADSTVISGS